MESKLISELICTRCLRYFSNYDHLEKELNIKFSIPNFHRHQKCCNLHFRNPIFDSDNLKVYCISPSTLKKERNQCGYIAETMSCSGEVHGDMIGWYAKKKGNSDPGFAFVPVFESKAAGLAIVRKRWTHLYTKDNFPTKTEPKQNWCAEKIWIYEPYRHKGIASKIMYSIAEYFQEDISNLGYLIPFTEGGKALAFSLTRDMIYLAV